MYTSFDSEIIKQRGPRPFPLYTSVSNPHFHAYYQTMAETEIGLFQVFLLFDKTQEKHKTHQTFAYYFHSDFPRANVP